jgi:DNA adenine methylase
VRPPIPYFGGKMLVGPAIADLLPAHKHYVEPFCGSLAVLLAKPPSVHETVNDLDLRLMTFWRMLRDRPDELARVCALTPHSRAEFGAANEPGRPDDLDNLEIARRVFVRLTQARSGQMRRTGWRNYVRPSATSYAMPDYLAAYVDRIAPAAERLQHVTLESLPALDIVTKYGVDPEVLLYVDPPYLLSTRSKTRRSYEHEMLGEDEHRELAEALHAANSAVVISGYASDLYDRELYAGWDRHTIAAGTGQGEGWGNRTEVLWSNRPLGTQPRLDFEVVS